MTELDELIADAEAFAAANNISISTLSRKLFGDGTRIHKIKTENATATFRVVKRARERLSGMKSPEAA